MYPSGVGCACVRAEGYEKSLNHPSVLLGTQNCSENIKSYLKRKKKHMYHQNPVFKY